MGYRREDYVRIKAEFSEKYLRARTKAEERRQELYAKIPEVKQLKNCLRSGRRSLRRTVIRRIIRTFTTSVRCAGTPALWTRKCACA